MVGNPEAEEGGRDGRGWESAWREGTGGQMEERRGRGSGEERNEGKLGGWRKGREREGMGGGKDIERRVSL